MNDAHDDANNIDDDNENEDDDDNVDGFDDEKLTNYKLDLTFTFICCGICCGVEKERRGCFTVQIDVRLELAVELLQSTPRLGGLKKKTLKEFVFQAYRLCNGHIINISSI